jgi:signal transduction histidine kinase
MTSKSPIETHDRLRFFETALPHAWVEWSDGQICVQNATESMIYLKQGVSLPLPGLIHTADIPRLEAHLNSASETIAIEHFNLRREVGIGPRLCSAVCKFNQKTMALWTLVEVKDRSMAVLQYAAHDLKAPVNSIIGLVNIMQHIIQDENIDRAELGKMLEMIKLSCNHSVDLLTDIMELAELESSEYQLATTKVKITDFIANYVHTHRLLTLKKRIQIQLRAETNAPVAINEIKLTRVFNNLFSNAVKFSHPGSFVHVITEEHDGLIDVIVQDEGVGMAPHLLNDLFVKFGRSQRKGLDGEMSHGLGMSIVKQIMELHQGGIQVHSEVGKGTRVTLTFKKAE